MAHDLRPHAPATSPADGELRGEVVYIYSYDIAYDMRREPLRKLLGEPMEDHSIVPDKRSPRHVFFYSPQQVVLPPQRRAGPGGPVEVRRSVKLFNVGAISIQVRVPFRARRLEDLVAYHDLCLDEAPLEQEVRELAERVRAELAPHCVRPVAQLRQEEAYTVFCLDALPAAGGQRPPPAEEWFAANRRAVASLLMQETSAGLLSEQEAAESTGRYVSYYEDDLVVTDWDAALIVGGGETREHVLHILDVANVQLEELEAYDRILSAALEGAYRDVARWPGRVRRTVSRSLREIRVDLARLSDELGNITKFFGDWHLARIYQDVAGRFHLGDWHSVIGEKLKTLGDLYELIQRDRTNAWMVFLEATIVLLFILDVVILLMGL